MMSYGLGNEIDGIRVIEKSRMRADRLHVLDDAFHDVNRSQRHEEAAGPLRFLSNHAVFKWNALVKIACLKASRSETCQYGITISQSCAPIRGSCNGQV